MIIDNNVLEKTCKDMIETILFCLSDATKGTIYRVGQMPKLQVVRVTSGVREPGSDQIQWGMREDSGYNFPGKSWEQYKDYPGRVMEAVGWCVERQKSWTADNPYEDIRSVRKQLRGEIEDFHHMEPVLVRKSDLYVNLRGAEYPLDHAGQPIWQGSDYVVVALIKIHFKPQAIKRGDRSTKIIKKLSRTLGTELLSLHARESLAQAQKGFARQRLQSCNIVAHELRHTLMKMAFIRAAVNVEFGFLREQWEAQLAKAFPELESKQVILNRLSHLIQLRLPIVNGTGTLAQVGKKLIAEQQELSDLPLMPQSGERWLDIKIRPKWNQLLVESHAWDQEREEIERLLQKLERVIWAGMDEKLAQQVRHLPEELTRLWPKLAYTDFTEDKVLILQEILQLLDHPDLSIPHQQYTKKILSMLKPLVEMIPELNERIERIISHLKNGSITEDDHPQDDPPAYGG